MCKNCQSDIGCARERWIDALFEVENEALQAEAIGQMLADIMDATEQTDVGDAVVKAFEAFDGKVCTTAALVRAFESVAKKRCNIFAELAKK